MLKNKYTNENFEFSCEVFPPKRDEDIRTFEESKFYWINIQQETSKKSLIYLFL